MPPRRACHQPSGTYPRFKCDGLAPQNREADRGLARAESSQLRVEVQLRQNLMRHRTRPPSRTVRSTLAVGTTAPLFPLCRAREEEEARARWSQQPSSGTNGTITYSLLVGIAEEGQAASVDQQVQCVGRLGYHRRALDWLKQRPQEQCLARRLNECWPTPCVARASPPRSHGRTLTHQLAPKYSGQPSASVISSARARFSFTCSLASWSYKLRNSRAHV